jgi:hypothetical protein
MRVFQNNSIYRIDADEKVLFMFFKAFREWIYNPVLTNGSLIQVALLDSKYILNLWSSDPF